jgi:predicted dehydrogenase
MSATNGRKSYVLVGTGSRSEMYINAIVKSYAEHAALLAICDSNQTRMDYHNAKIEAATGAKVPTYKAGDFDKMIKRISAVRHRNLHGPHAPPVHLPRDGAGLRRHQRKAHTIDAISATDHRLKKARPRTARNLQLPLRARFTKVKEVLKPGSPDASSASTSSGCSTPARRDYFRRWHRDKRNNGGLLVHKSTHHFDLVNWWLDSAPKKVMAMGDSCSTEGPTRRPAA